MGGLVCGCVVGAGWREKIEGSASRNDSVSLLPEHCDAGWQQMEHDELYSLNKTST